MSALSCNFCGRIAIKPDGWRQVFTRSFTSHDDEIMYMMCPKCHKTLIEDNVGAVIDPDAELEAIRESLDDEEPAKIYIGMPLRDFLSSSMYLKTQNIYFEDKIGTLIQDYLPCMDARIIGIESNPDEKGRRKVTLNIEV